MPHRPARPRHARGFTLIEIMVVIVILGVLAALVVPRVLDRPDEARRVAAKADIAAIVGALKLYRLDNQRYPTGEQGIGALVAKPELPPVPGNWKPGGYLERLPNDPWGHPYRYLNIRPPARQPRRGRAGSGQQQGDNDAAPHVSG